jgi:hypothetical protein
LLEDVQAPQIVELVLVVIIADIVIAEVVVGFVEAVALQVLANFYLLVF